MSRPPYAVVVVDDVEGLRRLVRIVLESSGSFRVVAEAGDGAEAVALVGRLRPDLVLLDLSMPVLDGLAALPLIREAHPAARVVVLSGFFEAAEGRQALERGAVAYVEKGARAEDLVRTLVDAMERPPLAPPQG